MYSLGIPFRRQISLLTSNPFPARLPPRVEAMVQCVSAAKTKRRPNETKQKPHGYLEMNSRRALKLGLQAI